MSKAGVIMLTKYLAAHLAPTFRVNCIAPAALRHKQGKEFIEEYSKKIPLGRMMEPGELNKLVEYLCTDDSSYVTGATLQSRWRLFMLLNDLFIIAEIGINANGSLDNAKKLIDMAKDCGCDAVKFQKRTIDVVYTPEFLESYRESPWGTTQRAQKEGLEFGRDEYDQIDTYCNKIRIKWSASAWDLGSQQFLRKYDRAFNKIASAMLTHLPLLEMVAQEGKHTFISTGMSTFEQIDEAADQSSKTENVLIH